MVRPSLAAKMILSIAAVAAVSLLQAITPDVAKAWCRQRDACTTSYERADVRPPESWR